MALNGAAPPRGSAAAAAANLRRRRTGGTGGATGGTAGNMLQFYTDDAPGLKISPNVVLVMSIGFIAFVAVLHVVGSLPFTGDEKKQGVLALGNQKPVTEPVDEFENWVSKQCLPVEAAITTITGAVPGAVMGVIVEALFEGTCLATSTQSPSFGGTLDPQILSRLGGYKPLIQSFVAGGAFEQVRNFAVMTGVNSGISCVMKKLRGKEDVQTSIVSGFGSGVMVSLVTGMRGPSVMSVGIVFALANAGLFKLEEKCSQEEVEDVSHDKTRGMFSCMGLGLDHYAMNFNNGLLIDNMLTTDRKDVKTGGRRAWLRSSCSNIGRY